MSHEGQPKHEFERPFLERYYSAQRRINCARTLGRMSVAETVGLDRRFETEVASGFSEALNGRVATEYAYDVIDGKIVDQDGEPLENMMLRSRAKAYEMFAADPLMEFVPQRFEAEINELHQQQAMINGEVEHNTIFTVSPMTMELMHRPDLLKNGFQRPDLTRSMVRISRWDGVQMRIFTRSLDHSSLDLLRSSIEPVVGHTFTSTDSTGMLGEQIYRSQSVEEARSLLDKICDRYDINLEKVTGKPSRQGAFAPESEDLLKFVEAHRDILDNIKVEARQLAKKANTYQEFNELFNGCLYKHLALFDQLLHGGSYNSADIGGSAGDAGISASEDGKSYSMCGEIVSSSVSVGAILGPQTGFESLMAYSGVRQQCPNRNCKKMVVVEDKHLRDGILHCRECHLTVSVCGEDRKADKVRTEAVKARRMKQLELAKKNQKIKIQSSDRRHTQRILAKV